MACCARVCMSIYIYMACCVRARVCIFIYIYIYGMLCALVKAHVVGIHIANAQVAVGVVVAIRLVVSGISQPPSAAVGCLPRILLSDVALHSVLHAATTTIGGTSHVNNQVGLLRVV